MKDISLGYTWPTCAKNINISGIPFSLLLGFFKKASNLILKNDKILLNSSL
jgi:hypothetical protein